MHNRVVLVVAVSFGMILNTTYSYLNRKNTANADVFNVLLGLYKLNPLKGSKVYKTFSDQLLTGRSDKSSVPVHFDSNEKVKEHVKINLNEIEKIIHVKTKKPGSYYQKPEYDIDDADNIENFTVDIVVKDRFTKEEEVYTKPVKENNSDDDFSAIFGHIGSNEIDREIPATKLLPIKETKIKVMQPYKNHNDAILEIMGKRNYYVATTVVPLIELRNDVQGPMDTKLDMMEDVIVL